MDLESIMKITRKMHSISYSFLVGLVCWESKSETKKLFGESLSRVRPIGAKRGWGSHNRRRPQIAKHRSLSTLFAVTHSKIFVPDRSDSP
jgi:hypothetical protein